MAVIFLSMTKIAWRNPVEKQINCIPEVIIRKFRLWVYLVEESGIREVRKHKGFHDEPLKGKRHGQRSVRLSRAYRAIHQEREIDEAVLIEVIEVNRHEY
jgi:toxin HigB-1